MKRHIVVSDETYMLLLSVKRRLLIKFQDRDRVSFDETIRYLLSKAETGEEEKKYGSEVMV